MVSHVALGSNIGDRGAHLSRAVELLCSVGQVTRLSPVFDTAPLGPSQHRYLNAALALATDLSPAALLEAMLRIERELGRVRTGHFSDRTIDLDLLLAEERVLDTPGLVLPHPHLHERGFVLAPLVTIAADTVVPTLQKTVRELFAAWCATDGQGVTLARDPSAPLPFCADTTPLSACSAALSSSV